MLKWLKLTMFADSGDEKMGCMDGVGKIAVDTRGRKFEGVARRRGSSRYVEEGTQWENFLRKWKAVWRFGVVGK